MRTARVDEQRAEPRGLRVIIAEERAVHEPVVNRHAERDGARGDRRRIRHVLQRCGRRRCRFDRGRGRVSGADADGAGVASDFASAVSVAVGHSATVVVPVLSPGNASSIASGARTHSSRGAVDVAVAVAVATAWPNN